MEKNKRSYLDKLFGTKKPEDGKSTGKICIPCGALNAESAKFCFACGSGFSVIYDKYDAFISYRREPSSDLASLIKVQLENNFHKRVFIDVKELQEGRFDEALLYRIEETPNFILILSKSSLDNCKEKSDWLKREIMHAIDTRRNIIPVLMKGFTFPTDDLWELLPKQMRILSSLNGIIYDHIHQDADIRKIASYMKSEKEVPTVKPGPVEDEQEPPPPPGGGTTKPGPVKSGSTTPGQTSSGPSSSGQTSDADTIPGQTTPGQTSAGQTTPGQTKPLQVQPPRSTDPPGQKNAPYYPVTAILVKDQAGNETILTEFGVRVDSGGPRLEDSNRDDLTIAVGQGQRQIPWGQIESIAITQREDATIKLCDGASLDHVKLHPRRLVGKNQEEFSFSFEFSSSLTITTLRDSTLRGPDELINYIRILANRAIPQARRWTLTIQPEGEGFSVTADNYFYNDLKNTHTFMMPGPHKFSAHGKFVNFTVSPTAGENFTMELFPVETALALAIALTRLNSLLSENNSPDEKKKTPESVTQESFVFLKRGEYLTVGSRDSKILSHYYGPGTVLKVKEKGKGSVYPWYRLQGSDANDYWFEGPGPVDTTDRRVFFKIDETGQIGYMVELLGERTDPWGSLEEFKIDDETVGPTVVRFNQIVSMTSKNGEITLRTESGFLSGTLQKLGNYNGGSWTKGPCLVTSDAVIPLALTNRVSSMTLMRINESEKPPLIPALIYSDKTQLKFISQTNSSIGHFAVITPDIYIQLDEKELGRMRISIPQIVRISVDPASLEAPVKVETTSGRVYKGTCLDPFNFSGSVMLFENVKKPLVLISTIHGSTAVAEKGRPNLSGLNSGTSDPVMVGNIDDQSWFMKTTEGPGQRSNFGMVYDYRQEVIILHGGFGKGNVGNRHYGMPELSSMSPELHDTWTWDGSSWRLLSNFPLSLVSHAMAYDKKSQQNIISGGWTGIQRLQDTHILTGDKWIKAENGIEFYKGGFSNHAMAYDEKRKTIILFGGLTVMFGRTITLGDTWEWNGSTWSKINVTGPGPRWGHTMVYDQSIGAIVLFGGNNGTTYFDDTWIWEGNSASWRKVSSNANPSARGNHRMDYDSFRHRILLFGGLSSDNQPLNDLWEWNGKEWILLMEHTPPKPRYNHGFVYDPKRNKSILYGGTDGKENFRDTWEWGI